MAVDDRVKVVRELIDIFALERYAYLAIAVLSVLTLLTSAAFQVFNGPGGDIKPLVGLFGSSGVLTLAIGRILSIWNQAFMYVTELERRKNV
ncbi:hypothetical protein [Paraburkholderia sp. BR10936]|uniref:hypothetical protein n=1 Tax=Paraburkholderia sp. BR10936 TaxID=3236993 RepID=UPI0034D1B82B